MVAAALQDILEDPKRLINVVTGHLSNSWLVSFYSRDVSDVEHKVVAVGSRSVKSAQEFIDREIKDTSVKAYGSYDEMLADPV